MKRRILSAVVTGMVSFGLGHAHAAGPFDGQWSGEDPVNAQCGPNSALFVALVISDNKITDYVKGTGGTATISSGTVGPDGKAHIRYGGAKLTFEADVQFSGNKFETDLSGPCGIARHVVGSKG